MVAIEPVDAEKVAVENPQSRFRVIDTAILPPGICALCGSSGGDGRQFVDFGKTVDWYGCVYFCTWCIVEAASLLGMDKKSNWVLAEKHLQDEISKMDVLYIDTKAELDAARVLLRNCRCSDGNPDDGVTAPVSMESEESEANPEPAIDGDKFGSFKGFDDLSVIDGDDESEPPKRIRRKT